MKELGVDGDNALFGTVAPFLEDVGGLWCHAIDTPIRLPMPVTNRNGKATEIPTNNLDGAV